MPHHHCCHLCLCLHHGGVQWQHGNGGICRGHAPLHCAADTLPAAAVTAPTTALPTLPAAVLPPMTTRCRRAATKLLSWLPLPRCHRRCNPPLLRCRRHVADVATTAVVTALPLPLLCCHCCHRAAATVAALPPCCLPWLCCHCHCHHCRHPVAAIIALLTLPSYCLLSLRRCRAASAALPMLPLRC